MHSLTFVNITFMHMCMHSRLCIHVPGFCIVRYVTPVMRMPACSVLAYVGMHGGILVFLIGAQFSFL